MPRMTAPTSRSTDAQKSAHTTQAATVSTRKDGRVGDGRCRQVAELLTSRQPADRPCAPAGEDIRHDADHGDEGEQGAGPSHDSARHGPPVLTARTVAVALKVTVFAPTTCSICKWAVVVTVTVIVSAVTATVPVALRAAR